MGGSLFRIHEVAPTDANGEIRYVERPDAALVDRRRKLLLECDDESYDFRSVKVLSTRFVVREIEVVRFVCPRCGRKHQSLLFG